MKLSICTDVFGKIPFTQMLDTVKAYGLDGIEMTAGGWGGCNFIPSAAELINDKAERDAFKAEIDKRGLEISALNCSGNPLIDTPMGKEHNRTIHDTLTLAGQLGVKTIVCMSALPAGASGDKTPTGLCPPSPGPSMTASTTWARAKGTSTASLSPCGRWTLSTSS